MPTTPRHQRLLTSLERSEDCELQRQVGINVSVVSLVSERSDYADDGRLHE